MLFGSLASVVALSCIAVAAAQYSNVVCSASYSWASNSLNQDPCVVASYLESQCDRGGFTVTALSPNAHYIGPNASESDLCQCNAVVYSLICACAACQEAQYVSWHSWTTNCGSNTSESLPSPPPLGTVVPSWAYLSIGNGGSWNATAAYENATAGQLPPTTSAAPATNNNSHSKIGEIVGGTVAGGVGVLLLAYVVVLWMRRRRRRRNQKRVESFPFSRLSSGDRGSSAVFYYPDDHCAPQRVSESSTIATTPPTMPTAVYHQYPERYADI
ncbi:hypothetical protein EDD16DRAFT_996455 [Pisolithus croceorrhizus]|nr:hypothetical protein EDD16DRAFT_996455 [Pisolithus croceorrhizus]KAI6131820.1 hypothetical protein EV401DRAFT_316938 [Pisolithus croceorrhizus]